MVDCRTRSVRLVNAEGKKILMFGKQSELVNIIIFAMFAKKMIVQGANAYLAYIMDTLELRSEISQVLVVRELLDIFPEKLPRMPLERERDFLIELEPGTALISCTPYKIAPLERKELKEQLQCLLCNNFVC